MKKVIVFLIMGFALFSFTNFLSMDSTSGNQSNSLLANNEEPDPNSLPDMKFLANNEEPDPNGLSNMKLFANNEEPDPNAGPINEYFI